jgi:hypothetical protein
VWIRGERCLVDKFLLHLLLGVQRLYQQEDAGNDKERQQNFVVYHGFLTPVTLRVIPVIPGQSLFFDRAFE